MQADQGGDWAVLRGLKASGASPDGGFLDQSRWREADLEGCLYSPAKGYGQEGMASQGEEVVADPDLLQSQKVPPEVSKNTLDPGAWGLGFPAQIRAGEAGGWRELGRG